MIQDVVVAVATRNTGGNTRFLASGVVSAIENHRTVIIDTGFSGRYIVYGSGSVDSQRAAKLNGECIARFVGNLMSVKVDDNGFFC